MDKVFYLNNGVKLADLYTDLDKEKLKKIESASKNGFTQDELAELEAANIDVSIIKENSSTENKTTTNKKSDSDIQDKIEKIKNKYCSNLAQYSGDIYSAENPELKALSEAINIGMLKELAKEGFNKKQIITIIAGAFPNVGINHIENSDKYSIPQGHGEEASAIYKKFASELLLATGEGSAEITEARNKINRINNQIRSNTNELLHLESEIINLQDEVSKQIKDAINASKEIKEEQKKTANKIIDEELQNYTDSNGKISYDDFKSNVASKLDKQSGTANSKLSKVVLEIIDAQKKMNILNEYLSRMEDLNLENIDLGNQADDAHQELDDLIKKQEEEGANADPDAQSTDPIGFSTNTTRYDFFVDNDDNNDITNENEFLGAKDGFAEMRNLDTNGDNLVDADELNKGNVKIIQTNSDGSQKIIEANNIFTNKTDGIDLSSYNATSADIGDGNKLLGTFNAKIGTNKLDGYQTLDTIDWLDKNYEFSDEKMGIGRFAQNSTDKIDLIDFSDNYKNLTTENLQLENELENLKKQFNINEKQTKNLFSLTLKEAQNDGKKIEENFKNTQAKEEAKKEAEEKEIEEQEKLKKLEELEQEKE